MKTLCPLLLCLGLPLLFSNCHRDQDDSPNDPPNDLPGDPPNDPPGDTTSTPYADFRQKWVGAYNLQHDSTHGWSAVYGPPGTPPSFNAYFSPANPAWNKSVTVRFDTTYHIGYNASVKDSAGVIEIDGYFLQAYKNGNIAPYENIYNCYNEVVRARFSGDTLFFSKSRSAAPCEPSSSKAYYHGVKQ